MEHSSASAFAAVAVPPRQVTSGFLSSLTTLAVVLALAFTCWAISLLNIRRNCIRRLSFDPDSAVPEQQPLLDGESTGAATPVFQPGPGYQTPSLGFVTPRKTVYEWSASARGWCIAVATLVFGINIFSIVASVITEPLTTWEPKFWLCKVAAIPFVTIFLVFQLFQAPGSTTPAQINHTLLLLLALIIIILAPILTQIPTDSDNGRLSLARRILEHVAGPSLVMSALVAVHYIVHEVYSSDASVQESLASSRMQPPEYAAGEAERGEGEAAA